MYWHAGYILFYSVQCEYCMGRVSRVIPGGGGVLSWLGFWGLLKKGVTEANIPREPGVFQKITSLHFGCTMRRMSKREMPRSYPFAFPIVVIHIPWCLPLGGIALIALHTFGRWASATLSPLLLPVCVCVLFSPFFIVFMHIYIYINNELNLTFARLGSHKRNHIYAQVSNECWMLYEVHIKPFSVGCFF